MLKFITVSIFYLFIDFVSFGQSTMPSVNNSQRLNLNFTIKEANKMLGMEATRLFDVLKERRYILYDKPTYNNPEQSKGYGFRKINTLYTVGFYALPNGIVDTFSWDEYIGDYKVIVTELRESNFVEVTYDAEFDIRRYDNKETKVIIFVTKYKYDNNLFRLSVGKRLDEQSNPTRYNGEVGRSSTGSAFNVAGWSIGNKSIDKDASDESGKIVFRIKVDQSGSIVAITVIETDLSPSVTDFYKRQISRLRPQPKSSVMPEISTGTVVINVRSR